MATEVSTEKQPVFSIFLPTWNNLPFLKLCVESIEKNSAFPHEILIHVNDGSDGTLEWVRQKGYKHTHSEKNVGVCWAMNGLRPLMTTDYIVYINDDMYMCPGWDTAFMDEIKNIGNKMFFLASTTIQPKGHKYRKIGVPVFDFGRTPQDFKEKELLERVKKLEIPDTRGCVWPPNIVHRDLWDLVGGYSIEFYPGMGSDPDFTVKLMMAGVTYFKTLGNSLCYHFMSVSVNRVTKNKGEIQFLRKWGLTVRAFLQQYQQTDRLWSLPLADTKKRLRKEHFRSAIKRIYTCLKTTHAPRL